MGEGTIDKRAFITGDFLLEALQPVRSAFLQCLVRAPTEIPTSLGAALNSLAGLLERSHYHSHH
jgi:hypothetical protein